MTLPTRKAQALLAYLAVRPGQGFPRDKLTALLWGDRREAQARDSLRHTLVALRKVLPSRPPGLVVEGRAVALDPTAIDIDVVRFSALVDAGTAEALAQAAEVYQGDFLEGFVLREPSFEEWLVVERERLRERALDAFRRLLDLQHAGRAIEPAIRTALRLLELDATQESAHRALMRLYAQQGRRATALRQYQTCVGVLQRELGIEPEVATRQLYQEIIQRHDNPVRAPPASSKSPVERAGQPPSGVRAESVGVETALIGRATELATLRNALAESQWGRGSVIALIGEVGVGKSRLAADLARTAAEQDARVLLGRCYESEQMLPFGPWVDALRAGQVVPEDPTLLALEPVWLAELGRLFPEIVAAGSPAPSSDARRLFESVVHVIRSLATRQPVLVVLEDVHWADEMSLRLLGFLGHRITTDRVLVAATARAEELADADALRRALGELRSEGHVAELVLSPLSRADTSSLVRSLTVAGSESHDMARLEEQAWATSAGNPFVIVELVRALGDGMTLQEPANLSLPQRVRDVIAGRVERVSDRCRQLLCVAAVIGREFDFALLQRACGLTDRDAAAGVEELVRRRMLHVVDEGFDFTHDRIREVVYGALLPPRRTLLHGDVAVALEALTAGTLDPPSAALGMHYRHAEAWDKAVFHLRQAAGKAFTRSALPDARIWFEQALSALAALPETSSTLEQAFDIRLELRPVLVLLGEPRRTLERLREAEVLAEKLNDDHRRGRVCAFLSHAHSQLGELDEALVTGTRALEIARKLGDASLGIVTAIYLEQTHYYRGEYERAVALAIDSLATLPAHWVHEYFGMGALPAIWHRCYLVMNLAELGRFTEAAPHVDDAIQLAEPTKQAFNIGVAYRAAGTLELVKGDWAKARLLIEHGLGVFRTANIVLHIPWAVASSAWVLAQLGEANEALDRLREGEQLAERQETMGIVSFRGWAYHALGRAGLRLGRLDEARRLADHAVNFSRSHLGLAAHALHLLGDVATHPDRFDASSGEAHYRQALALAEPRGMRPLVAHCHLGLGTLYGRLGTRDRAREHLAVATTMYREMEMPFWLEQAGVMQHETA